MRSIQVLKEDSGFSSDEEYSYSPIPKHRLSYQPKPSLNTFVVINWMQFLESHHIPLEMSLRMSRTTKIYLYRKT